MSKFTGHVLALDLATVMGYAYGKPGGDPKFGSLRLGKPGASRAALYRRFRLWLDLFCGANETNWIVYESPALPMIMQGRTQIETIRLMMGLAEHLEEWSHQKYELREASVSQVRTHFIGQNLKSALAKPLVMERCRELGWPVTTSDEADAVALWDYQICFLRPDIGVANSPLFSRKRRA